MIYTSGPLLQYNSKGSEVERLQTLLNNNGYNLDVDGIFGNKTLLAVEDFQNKYGLDVDGKVGDKTWEMLTKYNGAPSSAPTYTEYKAPEFKVSDDTSKAGQAKTDAENALADYGDFSYGKQGDLDNIIDSILNRKDFSYDINGDALYQQYKDKYIQQGKLAMQDTMGQAAALTGGYGSSYAQSVGQQAYQAQLQNLNDIVPELYQMALDKYNREGDNLYNQYSMLSQDRNTQYGMWGDGYNRLVADRDYASGDYYNKYGIDWDKYKTDVGIDQTEHQNAYNAKYQKWVDEQSQENWEKEFDLKKKQYEDSKVTYSTDGNSSGSTNTNKTPSVNQNTTTTGFTGHTYSEGIKYLTDNKLHGAAANLMDSSEWNTRRSSYQITGQGSSAVKNYSTYGEYVQAYVKYALETNGK